MIAPCKGCTNRKLSCHSNCEKYKAFREEVDKIRSIQKRDTDFFSAEDARRRDCRKRREGFRPL